ncbi:MAG TPA: SDR family NAD(P)-dependent oxidoreductase [Candidatus Dormibacteraeota bacterium]|jgi:NAD(P)-dependent dehydrogenase (short-subunit alcohol dehydrogenase family)|nr:SDR family NAD(P)-dependent oxidoreductase [Candidatus Dormibacteraeota bacterium]
MGKLDGRVAVITGAGSGQGLAAARLFAEEGAGVVVAEYNEESGRKAADEISATGGKAVFAHCDVSQADQVKAAIDLAVSEFGGLNILYNNAGLWFAAGGNYRPGITDAPSPLLEENIWQRTIDVNLKGTYLGCKYAIPEIKKAGVGAILNVSSIAALRVGHGASDAYTAAKGGIMTMTRTLAIEHAEHNIRCNCIFPGAIDTHLVDYQTPEMKEATRQSIPMGRWGQPEDVAKLALFLASDDSSWITGAFFVIDGGFTAV